MAHPHPSFLPVPAPVFKSDEVKESNIMHCIAFLTLHIITTLISMPCSYQRSKILHNTFLTQEKARFTAIRAITSYDRTPGTHGAKLTQIIPGLWTAHFNDIKEKDAFLKLTEITPPMGLVVNAAVAYDQCATCPGYYGPDVEVMMIDLFDDPKEGEAHTCAGDAKQYFKPVNAKIKSTIESGKSVLVHCMASLSRSVVLIIAYLMESKGLSSLDATIMLKSVWDPTWPNDRFVRELIEFEDELKVEV